MKEFFDFFKDNFFYKFLLFLYTLLISWIMNGQVQEIPPYQPLNTNLHSEISKMDSIFFNAYNNCDIKTQATILNNNIEFLHDQTGLSTSKEDIIKSTQKNICGKVTRTLIKGSIEVYPINNYGAVEIGYHKFFNNREPNAKSIPSKFIIVWKKEENSWQMTKVISLH
ncbi:nuclear transport factor 2 family protein [Tenacibaculum sp. IB213877]|uniref:nuclear transport factor 2 family protein n=1 Tax=Tenacibaculum sp. IB213877 TaxID=3097351 RepID=UPI002A5A606D|nr:nuclear transport factor 2 family protein [Tenacibaculum sp. IB213877]MDY0779951.1 nuclear transport factor 2 family protein [Tenacibaculum sp. IB213877]